MLKKVQYNDLQIFETYWKEILRTILVYLWIIIRYEWNVQPFAAVCEIDYEKPTFCHIVTEIEKWIL